MAVPNQRNMMKQKLSQGAIQRRMGTQGAKSQSQRGAAPPGQTTRLASRAGDTTASEAAREGLLRAQAQKMQGALPVGPEGTMPPSAKGALMLAAQRRMQEMQQQAQPAGGMSQGMPDQGAPSGVPGTPSGPIPSAPPGPLPMGGAAGSPPGAEMAAPQANPNMMDQQARWQEVMRRLQQAQQMQQGAQQGVM